MSAPTTTPPVAVPAAPIAWKVIVALLAVYLIWGSTYLAIRIVVETIPPFLATGARFFVAGLILFAVLRLRGTPVPSSRQIGGAALLGVMMLAVGTGGVAFAEQWVASGLAALAVAAVPLWAALFASLWGQFPRRLEWAGLGLGLLGVAMLNMESGMQANALGALLLLVGPMSWAFASMWSRRLDLPGGLMTTAVEMIGGGAALLLLSLITREGIPANPSTSSLLALLYLTTFGSLIAFSAYTYLLANVRPVLATSYAYVNPVVAVLLGIFLAGEDITALGIGAMVIILAGVGLLAFQRSQKSGPVAE